MQGKYLLYDINVYQWLSSAQLWSNLMTTGTGRGVTMCGHCATALILASRVVRLVPVLPKRKFPEWDNLGGLRRELKKKCGGWLPREKKVE